MATASEDLIVSDDELPRNESKIYQDEDLIDSDKKEEIEAATHEDLNCPLCRKVFRTPRRLPCLHSFCHDCLQLHISSTASVQGVVKQFSCPICGNVTCPGDFAIYKLVHLFPLNTLLLSSLMKSGVNVDLVCNACQAQDVISPAEDLCIVCEEALCDQCSKAHRSPRLTATHTILKIVDLPSKQEALLHNNVMFHCKEHTYFPIEYYCNGHETQLCVKCFIASHKKCPDVTDLTSQTPNLSDTMNQMQEQMEKLTDQFESFTDINESHLRSSEKEVEHHIRIINKLNEKLKAMIQNALGKINEKMKEDGSKIFKEEKTRIKQLKHGFRSHVTAFRNSLAVVESASKYATQTQMFLLTKKIINQLSMSKRHIVDKYYKADTFTLQLVVDPELVSIITFTNGSKCRLRMKRKEEIHVATDGFKPLEDFYIELLSKMCQLSMSEVELCYFPTWLRTEGGRRERGKCCVIV